MSEPGDATPTPVPLKEKIAAYLLPNLGDILFLLLLQIPLSFLPSYVFGDGSTGWHLVNGDYILQNHHVATQDLISYTHADAPWVAYEWLSDVLMAGLVKLGGLNLLAVAVASAVGLLIIFLYQRCRKEGAHFLLAAFMCTITVIIMAIHWLARPHLFTFFGVYLFTTRLDDFYRDQIRRWHLLVPLTLFMVLWVNCHPAFLFGFVLLAIYLVSSLFLAVVSGEGEKRHEYVQKVRWLGVTTLSCAAATLINPYGFALFQYISNYLKGSRVLANTAEFLSPVFHGALQPTCLEILFALLLLGLAFSSRRLSLPRVLVCLAFAHLALSAVRNMPLFAIIALPAIAQLSAGILPAVSSESGNGLRQRWAKMSAIFDENEALCSKHLWPILCVIVLAVAAINGGSLLGKKLLDSSWGPKDKPIATLDYLRAQEQSKQLDPDRGFNFDNWGGYLRYRLGTRVFIDDRADFYGERFYGQYAIINLVQPGWQKLLDDYKIQWILTPKNGPLAAALKETSAWRNVSEDEASVLFVR
jgi:hypothetical protein